MTLRGLSIAVLAYPGYQELEFWYPLLRSREEGATVTVVASAADGCESFLGYPVIGDAEPSQVRAAELDALIVPGAVEGRPPASEAQLQLIRDTHSAGRRIYGASSGAALVTELTGMTDDGRLVADADKLPELVRRLQADLAR
ncbi:MAG: protease [Pseudonocardiales bacterium]|jgi:protease I|nr:protease [Pseudonocardiales bacterium]